MKTINLHSYISLALTGAALVAFLQSCTSSSGNSGGAPQAAATPVLTLDRVDATTYREFPVTIEGRRNIEIRPQVDGYLDGIFVDEGDYVTAGKVLFRINDRPYREQLLNARAALLSAEANLQKAQLEVDRLAPLVRNNVVSDIQLKSAEADLASAKANVEQSRALVSNAEISLGYTTIKAPVDGYIGRIPMKAGSLVGRGEMTPLTMLTDIREVHAYFAMSEVDFLEFKTETPGKDLEDKLANVPPVELILADGSVYPEKGKIETVEGQFNRTTGSINFRATFPNNQGLLRSGNSGSVRIPSSLSGVVAIPQRSTFELQDKVLVFVVSDSNKVVGKPIHIEDRDAEHYFVREGITPGQRIVYSGLSRLRDGALIDPQPVNAEPAGHGAAH